MIRLTKNWSYLLKSFHSNPYGTLKDKRLKDWKKMISSLPKMDSSRIDLSDGIKIRGKWNQEDKKKTEMILLNLIPWRKGPFTIQDIFIDAEWQSNMKWDRVLDLGLNLTNKSILDVGSGNGYYGFRMLGGCAKAVICLEPNLSHLTQFLALNSFIESKKIRMIPLRIEELSFADKSLDFVFSMGVLYHQRNPKKHLNLLISHLKEEGQIIIETLVAPDEYGQALVPKGNYANMPNVRFIHTRKGLKDLISKAGLKILHMSSSVKTTPKEQRSSRWMPFRSFDGGFNQLSDKTVEGLPRPERIILALSKLRI